MVNPGAEGVIVPVNGSGGGLGVAVEAGVGLIVG